MNLEWALVSYEFDGSDAELESELELESFFFWTNSRSFEEYSSSVLGKWATLAYDTIDPRKAGHVAKTQSSYAYTRGLSSAVGKPPRHMANLCMNQRE